MRLKQLWYDFQFIYKIIKENKCKHNQNSLIIFEAFKLSYLDMKSKLKDFVGFLINIDTSNFVECILYV